MQQAAPLPVTVQIPIDTVVVFELEFVIFVEDSVVWSADTKHLELVTGAVGDVRGVGWVIRVVFCARADDAPRSVAAVEPASGCVDRAQEHRVAALDPVIFLLHGTARVVDDVKLVVWGVARASAMIEASYWSASRGWDTSKTVTSVAESECQNVAYMGKRDRVSQGRARKGL